MQRTPTRRVRRFELVAIVSTNACRSSEGAKLAPGGHLSSISSGCTGSMRSADVIRQPARAVQTELRAAAPRVERPESYTRRCAARSRTRRAVSALAVRRARAMVSSSTRRSLRVPSPHLVSVIVLKAVVKVVIALAKREERGDEGVPRRRRAIVRPRPQAVCERVGGEGRVVLADQAREAGEQQAAHGIAPERTEG